MDIQYSDDFKRKVKELYPNDTNMHNMADRGDDFLGRYLDDSSSSNIDCDTILIATSLDELQKKARALKQKKELYAQWYREKYKQK